jgi:iron complex outermembrane receptor protein
MIKHPSQPKLHLRAALLAALCAGGLAGALSAQTTTTTEPITELEKFIVKESSLAGVDTLLPNSRPVDSIFGSSRDLLDTPRSVTVLTPETIDQMGIKDVWDLARAVPGSTVQNYYGVPSIPVTRGLLSSIYFNGMQRVFNRNGYPTSFGSTEGMDYVRGPATANYSAALPGGYVNFIPKAPYFDKARGSLRFTLGQYDEFNTQVDVGAPVLVFGKPAAYRISITNQKADAYYKGYKNDYTSVYASFKAQLTPNVTVYTGGEYYAYRANENPGWNRVTQDLIDHDNYIYGKPKNDLTGPVLTLTLPSGKVVSWVNDTPGYVNRAALETATPFGGSRGDFSYSFFALGNGFNGDSGFRPANVASNADAAYLYQYFGATDNPTGATVKLKGYQTLSNVGDFADANTYLYFFDTVVTPSDTLSITNKFFIDAYNREKTSGYGYGELGRNLTIEDKVQLTQKFNAFKGINLVYGVSLRYEDSLAKTEFTVEPFNRRDISQEATPNDTLRSGNQRGNTGKNFWDPFGSVQSKVLDGGVFLVPDVKFTDNFSVIFSARWDNATWKQGVPFDLAADFNSGDKPGGGISYTNYSISPTYKLTKNTSLYATVQRGTAAQGFYVSGSITGDVNYSESSFGEVGIKTSQLDNKLFAAVTVYTQKLTNFDQRGGAFFPQKGKGIEFEAAYAVSKQFTITANASAQEVKREGNALPGGFVPLTPAQIPLYAGIFTADFGGRTTTDSGPIAGIPRYTVNLFAKYDFANGFGISGGPSHVPYVWGNPEKTLKLPAYTIWNVSAYYESARWGVSLAAKNLFSARYFNPFESFAGNAIILKGEPVHVTATFKYRF